MRDGVIVFDMDGVLVDVTESYREAIRETVRHFTGQKISHELIQDLKNTGGWNNDWKLSQKIVNDLGVEADYAAVVDYFQSIFFGGTGLIQREKWIPRDGLLETLGLRYRLAIFTGRLREEARVTLDRFAPEIGFEPIIGHDDVEESKPAPDGLLKIAAFNSGRPLWYVGDTVDDARSARAAGVAFVGIAAADNPRREDLVALFGEEGAVAVLENVNQLEGALAR